ncbi:Glucocorticoid modulatory element-binding protein 1 [Fukomys damarensis]|uniref:Glucocorticoid modulatory element-binding protein 1 n=1 Tax=Fukomys damarensis TaxID=885580 RepID=A0A091CUT0_FUKDA|nr:Glucocorticoid modulatory element-binding protein 1 [Fukomys damarensis]
MVPTEGNEGDNLEFTKTQQSYSYSRSNKGFLNPCSDTCRRHHSWPPDEHRQSSSAGTQTLTSAKGGNTWIAITIVEDSGAGKEPALTLQGRPVWLKHNNNNKKTYFGPRWPCIGILYTESSSPDTVTIHPFTWLGTAKLYHRAGWQYPGQHGNREEPSELVAVGSGLTAAIQAVESTSGDGEPITEIEPAPDSESKAVTLETELKTEDKGVAEMGGRQHQVHRVGTVVLED